MSEIILKDVTEKLKVFYSKKTIEEVECIAKELLDRDNKKNICRNLNEEALKNIVVSHSESFKNIKNIIMFVSHSSREFEGNRYEKTPLEKDIEVFKNLESIILLSSSQTKEIAKKLGDKYRGKGKKVILKEVDIDNLDASYNFIKELFKKDEELFDLNSEETVIDATLGLKIVSMSFYKAAVEEKIKTIDWVEPQISANGRSIRVPGKMELKFIEKIELESEAIYSAINKSIEFWNFDLTTELYKQINKDDYKEYYYALSNIFNVRSLMNSNNFKSDLGDNIALLKESAKKIGKNQNLLKLLEEQLEIDNHLIYLFFKNVFNQKKYGEEYIDFLSNEVEHNDEYEILGDKFKEEIRKISFEEFEVYRFILNEFKKNNLDQNILNYIEDIEYGLEEDQRKIMLNEEGIKINKLNLDIKFDDLEKKGVLSKVLKESDKKTYILDVLNHNKTTLEEELKDKSEVNKRKKYGEIKKEIKAINEELKEIFIKENKLKYIEKDFILLEDRKDKHGNKNHKKTVLKINEDFLF